MAHLLHGLLGDLWRCLARCAVPARWIPSHHPGPDPSVGLGAIDVLGNLIADGANGKL